MGKKKSNKDVWGWTDSFLWYFQFFGVILMLISLLPMVPWRRAELSPSMGSRFPSARSIGLFTVTNQYQQNVAWFKMKSLVCRRAQEIMRPNPVSMAMTVGVGMMSSASEGSLNTGGAMLGCSSWENCKAHVTSRCSTYTSIAAVGIGSFILILFGMISAIMSIVFLHTERRLQKVKQKKKEAAQWNTALASIFACLLPLFGVVVWVFSTQELFKGLKTTGYYPYPGANVGMYLSLVAVVFFAISMILGIRRQDIYKSVEDDDDEDEYTQSPQQPFNATVNMQPGMGGPQYGMGAAPPGMQPGMQQGMMQQGMAQPGMPPGMSMPPPPMMAR